MLSTAFYPCQLKLFMTYSSIFIYISDVLNACSSCHLRIGSSGVSLRLATQNIKGEELAVLGATAAANRSIAMM